MKRDLDLVRKILFVMEEMDETLIWQPDELEIENYSEEQIEYHLHLMAQAGLLHAQTVSEESQFANMTETSTRIKSFSISWNGHEFLSATRDETRWKKAKETISKVGGLATDVIIDLLKESGKQAAIKMLFP